LFLCNSEKYAETVPGTSFKEYPKYSYIPHKAGPKPRFSESTSSNLTNISRDTPFIFKGDPGRPRVSIPAKITPIYQHHHIKTTTRGYCLIYRNSKETQCQGLHGLKGTPKSNNSMKSLHVDTPLKKRYSGDE
jgi:hypothetical protein